MSDERRDAEEAVSDFENAVREIAIAEALLQPYDSSIIRVANRLDDRRERLIKLMLGHDPDHDEDVTRSEERAMIVSFLSGCGFVNIAARVARGEYRFRPESDGPERVASSRLDAEGET